METISLNLYRCKNFSYDTSTLPTAGVVLIFTDEMWSTLIRTIFSILDAGPEELITEIIIVDDASTRGKLFSLTISMSTHDEHVICCNVTAETLMHSVTGMERGEIFTVFFFR